MESVETDADKRARYHQRLEEHEASVEVVRRSFDIDEFISDANDELQVEIPEASYLRERQKVEALINAEDVSEEEFENALTQLTPHFVTVKYKRLTNNDIVKLNRIRDVGERGLQTLFLLLNKADSSITYDKIKKMDPIETSRITTAITEKTPIFLH